METENQLQEAQVLAPSLDQSYLYAARQLMQDNLIPEAVIDNLVAQGHDRNQAEQIVFDVHDKIRSAKKSKAQKDMLFGALWCVGGIIATAAHIGFIFWGAILFGGIQFFRGVANASGD
jgi:hypothetical protein